MFRTVYFMIYFFLSLLFLLPTFRKVSKLEKQGKLEEMQTLLQATAHDLCKKLIDKTGSTVYTKGLENVPEGPVLFVSNHQSNFDIPLLLGFIDKPKSFIAKKELSKTPMLNQWMKQGKCIFIDRENARQSLRAIQEGIQILKGGHSLVIFPEGTRSKSSNMREFKKGSLKLAIKSQVPIIPVSINGSYKMMEANKGFIKPATISLIISEPIYTEHLTKEEETQLSEQVERTIRKNIL
jgi:1-acyl-sn-glycerol-3-phosphate acyltransferase